MVEFRVMAVNDGGPGKPSKTTPPHTVRDQICKYRLEIEKNENKLKFLFFIFLFFFGLFNPSRTSCSEKRTLALH